MQDTREGMLRWLACAIEANAERSKSMVLALLSPAALYSAPGSS